VRTPFSSLAPGAATLRLVCKRISFSEPVDESRP
jgi:hypothetical protein